jgi:secondary thiamine-phosphate synthase enzyme
MSQTPSPHPAWTQSIIRLAARPRGIHLVTAEIRAGLTLPPWRCGLLHLFLQHTSASLALGENADPDVPADAARWLDRAIPDGASYFAHDAEGPDDMPAHLKALLFGTTLTIPIRGGALALGTWQGIWLGEHRDHGGERTIVATACGG